MGILLFLYNIDHKKDNPHLDKEFNKQKNLKKKMDVVE